MPMKAMILVAGLQWNTANNQRYYGQIQEVNKEPYNIQEKSQLSELAFVITIFKPIPGRRPS